MKYPIIFNDFGIVKGMDITSPYDKAVKCVNKLHQKRIKKIHSIIEEEEQYIKLIFAAYENSFHGEFINTIYIKNSQVYFCQVTFNYGKSIIKEIVSINELEEMLNDDEFGIICPYWSSEKTNNFRPCFKKAIKYIRYLQSVNFNCL